MVREIWYAQDGKIWISGQNFSVTGSDFTAVVKEISITGGGRDVEGVRAFGSGTNFYVFEKGQELFEASITTVKQDNRLSFALAGGSDVTYPLVSTGDSLRYPVNILYEFLDRFDLTGAGMRIKLANAWCTGKEMSLAVDDHMEETLTFKLAPENYQEEYTNDMDKSGLALTIG